LSLGVQNIALDHRGHGRSSVPSSDDFRPETLADDAAALLNHLGLKDVIVFGHSMGTVVASALAVRHSHLVKAIILIDPVYYSSSKQLLLFVEVMSGLDSPEVAGYFFGRTFYTPATPEWLKAWHRRRAFSVPHEVVSKCIHGLYGMEDSIGKWEIAKGYMNRRRCPRSVI
jgi:pimeloyl-ACP methyl ester carboxylesterase